MCSVKTKRFVALMNLKIHAPVFWARQDDEAELAGDDDGGSTRFGNMVKQGYECDKDPSTELGYAYMYTCI